MKSFGQMSGRRQRNALGSEYLNYQFGWVPLVSDLLQLGQSISNADLITREYARNSGKGIRRAFGFPPIRPGIVYNDVYLNRSPWISPGSSLLYNATRQNKGKVVRSWEVTKRRWFTGMFTYFLPSGDSILGGFQRAAIQARHLLGISLTPDSVWNLAPWSWAVDWFSNVGDVLTNWSNFAIDGQVLKYGYMMEHTISKYTYTFVGDTGFVTGNAYPIDVVLVSETKKRLKATPYGFGFSWDGFSPTQWAVTTALGLTRR